MTFTVEPDDTRERARQLEGYFRKNVLHRRNFCCSSFQECQSSHTGPFYEGQLHHLGRYYDIHEDGTPLRIAVVGQEYGGPPRRVTMRERRLHVGDSAFASNFVTGDYRGGRNPHMRGTTSILRLLFGRQLGRDYEGEFIQLSNGSETHIFEAFALTNYLLCSATASPDSSRGRSTSTMRDNCRRHYRRTLAILNPEVIICQSKGYWSDIRATFDHLEDLPDPLYRAHIAQKTMLVASFSHPSAPNESNWGRNESTPYLLNVVKPTAHRIRKRLGLAVAETE